MIHAGFIDMILYSSFRHSNSQWPSCHRWWIRLDGWACSLSSWDRLALGSVLDAAAGWWGKPARYIDSERVTKSWLYNQHYLWGGGLSSCFLGVDKCFADKLLLPLINIGGLFEWFGKHLVLKDREKKVGPLYTRLVSISAFELIMDSKQYIARSNGRRKDWMTKLSPNRAY